MCAYALAAKFSIWDYVREVVEWLGEQVNEDGE